MHAICEDYRAGATYDLQMRRGRFRQAQDRMPALVLWGAKGMVRTLYDPLAVWRGLGRQCQRPGDRCSGHYLAEERPEETLRALRDFLLP